MTTTRTIPITSGEWWGTNPQGDLAWLRANDPVHWDEDVFDDPMTFDIRRDPNEHVAFGFGPRFCLGAALARLELTVTFERLLERIPDLHLADEAEPAFRPANFVSGYEEMRVAFEPQRAGS